MERFYGHNYLSNVPLLSSVEVAWVRAVKRAGMTGLGSYAYVFARR